MLFRSVYRITPEAIMGGGTATNITKLHVPGLIGTAGLNRRTDRVSMEYDKDRYGVQVTIVMMDGAWSVSFWMDLKNNTEEAMPGIFPETYQSDHIPASLFYYDSRKKSERALLVGGQDGYIRKYSNSEKDDDGSNAIDSWATIGPLVNPDDPLGQLKITQTAVTLGEDSDSVTVGLYGARSADLLVKNIIAGDSPKIAKVFSGTNLLPCVRQKIDDGALAIKISNSNADESWSMEKVTALVSKSGRRK